MSKKEKLDYTVVRTGSKGNCVVIEDVMVDCGIPYKHLRDFLYDVKYLLLTHIHTDHINPTTLRKIKEMFPKLIVIGNYSVAQRFPEQVDYIINIGKEIEFDDYTFLPVKAVHNVLTNGYVWEVKGNKVCYMTDTNTYEHFQDKPYDYFFIEANYDEKKLAQIGKRFSRRGYDPFANAFRHASVQQAKTFYFTNRRDTDSELIELHGSERFK